MCTWWVGLVGTTVATLDRSLRPVRARRLGYATPSSAHMIKFPAWCLTALPAAFRVFRFGEFGWGDPPSILDADVSRRGGRRRW